MPEVHTCTCGGQTWTMHDAIITCVKCGKIYGLIWPEAEVHIESSGDFNKRIKEERPIEKPEMRDPVPKFK